MLFRSSLIGIMCSSIYKSVRASTVMAYAITGFFTFGTALTPMILTHIFRVNVNRILLDLLIFLNPFRALSGVLDRGWPPQVAGLSPWVFTIVSYLILSVITACIALLRFRKMRS